MAQFALILADGPDPVAWRVAAALAAGTGLRPLVVDTRALAPVRWSTRISDAGRTTTVVDLPLGDPDDELGVLWCRGRTLPMARFAAADPRDRDYAGAELRALVVAWLYSLGNRVVNTVDGDGLAGPSWWPIRWLVEAGKCGLNPYPVTIATSGRAVAGWRGAPYDARRPVDLGEPATDSVLVLGQRVLGELASQVGAGCLALAARAGCRCLELSFVRHQGQWRLTAVDPVPMLRNQLEVQAAADLLVGVAAGPPVGAR